MKNLLRKTMLLFFLSALIGTLTYAQQERDFKKLDEYIEKTRQDWKVPGIGVAIIEKDKMVHAKGYGFADLEKQRKVTPNTLFAIGSSSKAFTAASICLLADQQLLDLDEPVITYLPDFQLQDEYATKKMTPRDLLSHVSGLPRHDLVWYGAPKSRTELYQVLKHLEPSTSFRGAWQYQNLMYMTAGVLIEKVSGKSWEAFVQENFFDPLDMKTANFSVKDMEKAEDHALPYNEEEEELKKMDFRNIDAMGPAGSINASVTEMANWVKMHIAGGTFNDNEIIGKASLKQSHRPHSIVPGNASEEFAYTNYGLGWFITSYRGDLLLHHGGNIDGYSAMVAFMPMDSVGMVILTNKNGTGAPGVIREAIADFMMGNDMIDWNSKRLEQVKKAMEAAEKAEKEEDLNRVEGTQPSHELSAYTGKYSHPAYGEAEVAEKDGQLMVATYAGEFPLNHYHYDIFELDFPTGALKVSFATGMDGKIKNMEAPLEQALPDSPIVFEKQVEELEVEQDALGKYVGEYDLMGQVVIKIYVKEDYLRMFVPGQPEYKLIPIGEHEFKLDQLEGYRAKFTMEEGGDKAVSMSSIQPNGTFTAQRKE
jgi:CubicO group peptidase (beta-lactamase class C family)